MKSKFLLLLGVSGAGKSTFIHRLKALDTKFIYISPFVTRPLRPGEQDKVYVTDGQMDEMDKQGELLTVNRLYGIRYATPRKPIIEAFASGRYPLLDWPVAKLDVMRRSFPDQLYVVYVEPPSLESLQERLSRDGRDTDGSRLQSAREELEQFRAGYFTGLYHLHVVSRDNEEEVVQTIYSSYLTSLQE